MTTFFLLALIGLTVGYFMRYLVRDANRQADLVITSVAKADGAVRAEPPAGVGWSRLDDIQLTRLLHNASPGQHAAPDADH